MVITIQIKFFNSLSHPSPKPSCEAGAMQDSGSLDVVSEQSGGDCKSSRFGDRHVDCRSEA